MDDDERNDGGAEAQDRSATTGDEQTHDSWREEPRGDETAVRVDERPDGNLNAVGGGKAAAPTPEGEEPSDVQRSTQPGLSPPSEEEGQKAVEEKLAAEQQDGDGQNGQGDPASHGGVETPTGSAVDLQGQDDKPETLGEEIQDQEGNESPIE